MEESDLSRTQHSQMSGPHQNMDRAFDTSEMAKQDLRAMANDSNKLETGITFLNSDKGKEMLASHDAAGAGGRLVSVIESVS